MLAPPVDGTEALCDVLQLLGTAAVVVDGRGEVVGHNDAAKHCIGAGFHIRNRRLVTADPAANRALTQLIAQPVDGCAAHACADGQVIVARRNTRPLILRIVRLGGASRFHPAHAIVMVLDPGRVILPTELQLNTAFGLSCGEARLAIRLAAGESLASAAGICGISYETARTASKSCSRKRIRAGRRNWSPWSSGSARGGCRGCRVRTRDAATRRPLLAGRSPAFHQQPGKIGPHRKTPDGNRTRERSVRAVLAAHLSPPRPSTRGNPAKHASVT